MNHYEEALRALHAAANCFGGIGQPAAPIQRYQDVQAMHTHCTIRVPRVEVELCYGSPRDPDAVWRFGKLTDDQTQRMYELLMDNPAVIALAESIAAKLARGEIA